VIVASFLILVNRLEIKSTPRGELEKIIEKQGKFGNRAYG